MRTVVLMLVLAAFAGATTPAAGSDGAVRPAAIAVAQQEADDERSRREELRRRERELRREQRELERERRELEEEAREEARREREETRRERHVERRQEHVMAPRFWIGVGAGSGWAAVDLPCPSGASYDDCNEEGPLGTYSANVTVSGPFTALRLRGLRQQDKGRDSRTPYETAALIGSRLGHSNWYGFVGAGRIQHADDEFEGDAHGFAWEIVFAPASKAATGFELSFQGEAGEDVDFVAVNIGGRFGVLN